MSAAPYEWPPELQALRARGLSLQDRLQAQAAAGEAPAAELQAQLQALRQDIADLVLTPPPAPVARPSTRLLAACLGFVLLLGAAGYAWKGQPEAISPAPPPDRTEAMVQGLARRLQQQPEDVQGWSMLGRSYLVLGRHEASVKAYRQALALRPEDPDLMADLADALASQQQGSLEGEPAELMARALARDPQHLKALALSATRAERAGDRASARALWLQVQRAAPDEHPLRALAEQRLAEAATQPAERSADKPNRAPTQPAASAPQS